MNDSSPPKRTRKPRPVASVIRSKNSQFVEIGRRITRLKQIKSQLWPHLPVDLRPHCDLANYRESTLIFVARSPVWAARARHTSSQILHAAVNLCKIDVDRLIVRVDPKPFGPNVVRRPRGVSSTVADHLERVACEVDDPELKKRLKDIARRRR